MPRLWLLFAILAPSLCPAQVTGTFSLEKSNFAPGEPVFLSFTLQNEGKNPVEVRTSDPYSSCSAYEIHITRDGAPEPTCFQNSGGSCPSGALALTPGASRTERILLNFQNTSRGEFAPPVRLPGDYTVDASRELAYAPLGSQARVFISPDSSKVHQTLHLRVDPALELSPTVYAPYIKQLDSEDSQVRTEAARTLATLAPPALEPLLLTFANSMDDGIRQFAPLALANLATKASLAALAQTLLHTPPGTYPFTQAVEKLGETNDPAWMPILLEVADQHGAWYLTYAAQSGGEEAIPFLLARVRSPDPQTRNAAIQALGSTGRRSAIPLLINFLALSPNQESAEAKQPVISANAALHQLTHFYADRGTDGEEISTLQSRWRKWWRTSGSTSSIYKPGDCGATTKLP